MPPMSPYFSMTLGYPAQDMVIPFPFCTRCGFGQMRDHVAFGWIMGPAIGPAQVVKPQVGCMDMTLQRLQCMGPGRIRLGAALGQPLCGHLDQRRASTRAQT